MKKILTAILAVAFIISIVASVSASSDITVYTKNDDASLMQYSYDGTTKMLSSGYGFHKMTTKDSYDGFTWSNELRVNSVDAANTEKAYWGVSFSEEGKDLIGYWFADKKFKIVVDDVVLVEKEYDWQLLENKWYDIMIRKFGDTVTVYCDNEEMVKASSDLFEGKWNLSFSNNAIDIDIGCIGIFMGEDFDITDRQDWRTIEKTGEMRKYKYYNFSENSDNLYLDLPEKELKANETSVYLSRFEDDFTLAAEGDYVVSDIGYMNWTWADMGTYYRTGKPHGSVYGGYWFDEQKAGLTYDNGVDLFSDSSAWPSQANNSFAWKEGDTHNIMMRRTGSTIDVLIDGNVVSSYTNPGVFDKPISVSTAGSSIYFWSRYISYTMDNLVLKDLSSNKDLINLDFSEDLLDPETEMDKNTVEDIPELFINKTSFGNGAPGLLIKPTDKYIDGVNRYVEYDSWATDRANCTRELYVNPRKVREVKDFEVSADFTIKKIKSTTFDGEVTSGTPAGLGFSFGVDAPTSAAEGFETGEGNKYNLNDFTFSADVLIKSDVDMGFADHERHPEIGGDFYVLVGGTASKGYGCFAAGYDAKGKQLYLQYFPGDTRTNVIEPVPYEWPLDEWVNYTVQLTTVEDEYGLIPELRVYINGELKYTYQEEALCASGVDIGEEKLGFITWRKFDLQMAMDNVVVANGNADVNAEELKLGCRANGHVWDNGVVTLDATTKAEGAKLYTCKNCAQTKTEILNKLSTTPVDPSNPDTDDDGGSKKDDNDKTNPGTSSGDIYALASITALLGGVAVVSKKVLLS